MLASSENSEINFSEMESSSLNPTDVKSFDLLQGDTGLRSVMEIAQVSLTGFWIVMTDRSAHTHFRFSLSIIVLEMM